MYIACVLRFLGTVLTTITTPVSITEPDNYQTSGLFILITSLDDFIIFCLASYLQGLSLCGRHA
jgi:hypothetical protein